MATQEDKTNTAVIVTIFAIGGAAMIGGSAAIVGMTRAEVKDYSNETEAYADLSAISALRSEKRQQLTTAKIPIGKAQAAVLKEIRRDPTQASPPAPKPPPVATAEGMAGQAGAGNVTGAGGTSGTAAPTGRRQAAGGAAAAKLGAAAESKKPVLGKTEPGEPVKRAPAVRGAIPKPKPKPLPTPKIGKDTPTSATKGQ